MKIHPLLVILIIIGISLVIYLFLGKEGFTGTFDIHVDKPKSGSSNNDDNNDSTDNTTEDNTTNSGNTIYDNYNHYSGTSNELSNGMTFYGQNGGSIQVSMQSNGKPMLNVSFAQGQPAVTFTTHKNRSHDSSSSSSTTSSNSTSNSNAYSISNPFSTIFNDNKQEGFTSVEKHKSGTAVVKFYGPNGETAVIVHYNGQKAIKVTTKNGDYIYTLHPPTSSNEVNSNPYNPNYSMYNNTPLTYFGSTGVVDSTNSGTQGTYVGTPNAQPSSTSTSMTTSQYDYSSTLPQGIPKSLIPPGQEDLYILKSEIVPPVCPACPVAAACPREEKCPPCPACARCPEPAFECKKVPNYNSVNNEFLPVPVLNDFSTFGM